MRYLIAVFGLITVVACAVERELPPIDHPADLLIESSPVSEAPLAPPLDLEAKKRSRLPTPKRIQYGEVVIDPYIVQRPRCDRIPGQPSAAHPTIKCGTRIHVVDVETGKETFAVVTHRLSLEDGRILYLSPRIGKELGINKVQGAQAKIDIIEKGMSYNAPRPSPKDFKRPMVTR